jgi:hypothetical protein
MRNIPDRLCLGSFLHQVLLLAAENLESLLPPNSGIQYTLAERTVSAIRASHWPASLERAAGSPCASITLGQNAPQRQYETRRFHRDDKAGRAGLFPTRRRCLPAPLRATNLVAPTPPAPWLRASGIRRDTASCVATASIVRITVVPFYGQRHPAIITTRVA